jgi:membrane-associated phospholipid phosphatase
VELDMQLTLGLPTYAIAALLYSVATFAFLALAYTAGSPVVQLDTQVADTLHANLVPSATTALLAITTLGSTAVLAIVAATACAYLVFRRRGRDVALLAVVLVAAQALTWILKASFDRPRPAFDDPVATAGWFSFPSGHALSSIAVYGALAYVVAGGTRSARARVAVLGGVTLVVAAIGFSRLYLGVHYLTDVVAGYSAGLALLLLAIGALHPRSQRTVSS